MTTNILHGTLVLEDAPTFTDNNPIEQYDDYQTVTNKLQTQIDETATNLLVPSGFTNFSNSAQVDVGDDYSTTVSKLQGQINVNGGLLYQQNDIIDGGSLTMPTGFSGVYLDATLGELDSFTITLKASPQNGEIVYIITNCDIDSLTISANTGQTIGNVPTKISSGQPIAFKYLNLTEDPTWVMWIVPHYVLSASNASGAAVAVPTSTWTSIISLSLTPGKWLISAIGLFNSNNADPTGTISQVAIVTEENSGSGVEQGLNSGTLPIVTNSSANLTITVPALSVTLNTTTTYYVNLYTEYVGGSTVGKATIVAQLVSL